jgi:hypothetical protein
MRFLSFYERIPGEHATVVCRKVSMILNHFFKRSSNVPEKRLSDDDLEKPQGLCVDNSGSQNDLGFHHSFPSVLKSLKIDSRWQAVYILGNIRSRVLV